MLAGLILQSGLPPGAAAAHPALRIPAGGPVERSHLLEGAPKGHTVGVKPTQGLTGPYEAPYRALWGPVRPYRAL